MPRVKRNRPSIGKAPKAQRQELFANPWRNVTADAAAVAENRRLADLRRERRAVRFQSIAAAFVAVLLIVQFLVNDMEPALSILGIIALFNVWPIHNWRMRRLNLKYAASTSLPDLWRTSAGHRRELSEAERRLQEALRQSASELRRLYLMSQWIGIGSLIVPLPIMWFIAPYAGPGVFVVLPVFCITGAVILGTLLNKGNRVAAKAGRLIENAGVEAVGAVIDFIESSDPNIQGQALAALTKLLFAVNASDAPHVSPQHRSYLYAQLQIDRAVKNPKIAIAILHMIEQFGDKQAEPVVLELMSRLYPGAPEEKALVNAAHSALGAMRHADATLTRRGTLLSPAFAPTDQDAVLLRAAVSDGDQPSDQLLRSVPLAQDDHAPNSAQS